MKFDRKYLSEQNYSQGIGCFAPLEARFDNIDDLISSFKSGNLDKEQLRIMSYYSDKNGELDLGNPDEIIKINFEQEVIDLDYVTWNVYDGIMYHFKNNEGFMELITSKMYNREIKDVKSQMADDESIIISSEFDNGGTDIFTSYQNTCKTYLYRLESGDKNFVVMKRYNLKDDPNGSEKTIDCIWVFAEEKGIYYRIVISDNDLTDEQILKFGIKNK